MYIEENYLIFDSGCAAYTGEFISIFNLLVSIFIPVWFVVDYPVQWYFEVDICLVILFMVDSDGRHESLPIGLAKDK